MSTLAVQGGKPVRDVKKKPWPAWPICGDVDRANLLAAFDSGSGGTAKGSGVRTGLRRFSGRQVRGELHQRTAALELPVWPWALAPATRSSSALHFYRHGERRAEVERDPHLRGLGPRHRQHRSKAAAAQITPRTKAILPVHFAGLPADMDAFNALAAKHGVKIVEDAAIAGAASGRARARAPSAVAARSASR